MGVRATGVLVVLGALVLAPGAHAASPDAAPGPVLRIAASQLAGLPFHLGLDPTDELVQKLVYSGLYRFDDHQEPVPDLLTEPCTPGDEGRTLTCHMVETTFHDGSPLTADDVAYTFDLQRAACPGGWELCIAPGSMDAVEVVDPHTVRFRLPAADATFVTGVLTTTPIVRRADVEAAWAPFAASIAKVDPSELDRVKQALADDPGTDCAAAIVEPLRILEGARAKLWDRGELPDGEGGFDACAYAGYLAGALDALALSLAGDGLARVAAAMPLLGLGRAPNGTGPWRMAELRPADRMLLTANQAYHRGAPAIPNVEVVLATDPTAITGDLLDGSLDVVIAMFPELLEEVRKDPDLAVAHFASGPFAFMAFNLREGRLFADRRLRQAVRLCVDKARTVEAATDGLGVPIESGILPISWAYDPSMVPPARDVARARALIEAAGWTVGTDGIYQLDGRRLSAPVYVRGEALDRIRFAELVAFQLADCGIELVPTQLEWSTEFFPMMSEYPHNVPGTDTPYDVLVAAWGNTFDPDDRTLWHSTLRTELVEGGLNGGADNIVGFADPRVDVLLDEARATYDLRARARAYRQIQAILVEEQPYLFGYAGAQEDVLPARLRSLDGPLDLGGPHWWWQLERLTLD